MIKQRLAYLEENFGFDYVLETRDVSWDFTEFVVSCGGDVLRFRVYGNGTSGFTVCEK
jgi:hypothetical protein